MALQAAAGFPTLSSGADNDSMLRLVEVRDLIGGQGWFDLTQYRMGPPGGFVMHWSRLVDAPIAAIMLAASAVTGSMATGETVALVLWPAMLFGAGLYFLLHAVRGFAGGEAMLPALLIGAAGFHYIGVFAPGMLDHHNVQIVLALAMVSFLIDASARNSAAFGAAAGACAALQLGVAMEAVPYVAAAGLVVALWFLFKPAETFRVAAGLRAGARRSGWSGFCRDHPAGHVVCGRVRCVFAAAARGRQGFPGSALLRSRRVPAYETATFSRAAALGCLGLALGAMLAGLFPQCLGDPYAGLDPRLKSWWLDAVTEAQPLWKIFSVSPEMAAGHYATPLVALIWLAAAMRRTGLRRDTALVAAVLGAAFLVSLWQVRGSVFSIPFAVIPLAAFVAEWRRRATDTASTAAHRRDGVRLDGVVQRHLERGGRRLDGCARARPLRLRRRDGRYDRRLPDVGRFRPACRDAGDRCARRLQSRRARAALHAAPGAGRAVPSQYRRQSGRARRFRRSRRRIGGDCSQQSASDLSRSAAAMARAAFLPSARRTG